MPSLMSTAKAPALLLAAALSLPCAALRAQAPDVALTVGGRLLDSDQQLVLLEDAAGVEIRAAIPPPAAGPGAAASAGPGQALVQDSATSRQWQADTGRLEAADAESVRWIPAGPGLSGRVSIQMTRWQAVSARDAALGADEAPPEEEDLPLAGTARAAITLLPPVPFARGGTGVVDGVVIGVYPDETASDAPSVVVRNQALYRPPARLYRVDPTTRDLFLNRRATLGMLNPPLFSGEEDDPRLVAVSPRLLDFWDALCEVLDEAETGAHRLRVLRGFTTPYERTRLEAQGVRIAPYSRHMYGDALALIVDGDGDFVMDDLDGDGRVGIGDAEVLAEWVEEALRRSGFAGGLGVNSSFEGPRHAGTPYVHVDLRGWNERWRSE